MKRYKSPSLWRQLVEAYIERWRTHKALRLLTKQEWSVEFLTSMLIRAANLAHHPLEMSVKNHNGKELIIRTTDNVQATYKDDSIFEHLDDEAKVRQFVERVNKR